VVFGAVLKARLAARVVRTSSSRTAVGSVKHAAPGSVGKPASVRCPGMHTHTPKGEEGTRGSVHHLPGAQGSHGRHERGDVPGAHVSQAGPEPGPPPAMNPGRQMQVGPGAHTPPLPQVGQGTQARTSESTEATHPGKHSWQSGGAPPGPHAQCAVPKTGSQVQPTLPGGGAPPGCPVGGQGAHPGPACPVAQRVQVGPVKPCMHTQGGGDGTGYGNVACSAATVPATLTPGLEPHTATTDSHTPFGPTRAVPSVEHREQGADTAEPFLVYPGRHTHHGSVGVLEAFSAHVPPGPQASQEAHPGPAMPLVHAHLGGAVEQSRTPQGPHAPPGVAVSQGAHPPSTATHPATHWEHLVPVNPAVALQVQVPEDAEEQVADRVPLREHPSASTQGVHTPCFMVKPGRQAVHLAFMFGLAHSQVPPRVDPEGHTARLVAGLGAHCSAAAHVRHLHSAPFPTPANPVAHLEQAEPGGAPTGGAYPGLQVHRGPVVASHVYALLLAGGGHLVATTSAQAVHRGVPWASEGTLVSRKKPGAHVAHLGPWYPLAHAAQSCAGDHPLGHAEQLASSPMAGVPLGHFGVEHRGPVNAVASQMQRCSWANHTPSLAHQGSHMGFRGSVAGAQGLPPTVGSQ
jgi:hypothetical protein